MPIDRIEEHKTALRLPKILAERVGAVAKLTRISQNDLMVDACALLCDLAESFVNALVLPDSVVSARALNVHRQQPQTFEVWQKGDGPEFLTPEDTRRAAETTVTTPTPERKSVVYPKARRR